MNEEPKDLKEFEKWLKKARKNKDEQLPFVWQIMTSPFVEYHYSLLKDKSLDKTFRENLMSRFDEHHEEGQALLLSKLDNNEDIENMNIENAKLKTHKYFKKLYDE